MVVVMVLQGLVLLLVPVVVVPSPLLLSLLEVMKRTMRILP